MLGRGIDPSAVEQAVDGIDDRETALQLARGRARKGPRGTYEAFYAKVGGFLRRRGFDYEVTAAATRAAWQELLAETPDVADESATSETP